MLCEAAVGSIYLIEEMKLSRAVEMRLKALGMVEATRIQVLSRKRSGAVIFNVRGTRIAIGKDIAEYITVKEEQPDGQSNQGSICR